MKTSDTNSETVSQMSYTNWDPREPNYASQAESCVIIYRSNSYEWNDIGCSWYTTCSVCEIDI